MKNIHPGQLFSDNAMASRLWFVVSLLFFTICISQHFLLRSMSRESERVVVLDGGGTFSISPLLRFEEAEEVHRNIAMLASKALLSINANGFDFPELLERIFLKEALEEAKKQLGSIKEELVVKNISQKHQIEKIKLLTTRNDVVLAKIKGEVIRTGIFEGKNFVEAFPFSLRLTLVRNPNMLSNKRYPLAVYDFELLGKEDA